MLSEDDNYINGDEYGAELDLVNRFKEHIIERHDNTFFDCDDILVIIEHFIQNEDVEFARQAVNYACDLFPSNPDVALKNAKVTLAEGNLDAAYELLQEANEDSDEVEYLFILAQYYALCNKQKESIDTFNEALGLTNDPYERSHLHYGIAQQYMALKNYDKAISFLRKATVGADSFYCEIIFLELRRCFQYAGKLDDGIKYFNTYIDEHPDCLAAWNSLADCYRKLEKYDEAIEYYEYALAINPADMYANINLTNIYYDTEQYTKAIDTINEAVANGMIETNDTDSIIGDCYYNLQRPDKAEKYYKSALAKDPDDCNALSGMGFIHYDNQAYSQAIYCLEKSVNLLHGDDDQEILITLAEAYAKYGNGNEAVRTLELVADLWPTDPLAYCMMAKIHIGNADYASAAESLEKGLVNTDYDSDVKYVMAYFLLLTKKREEGLSYLGMALDDDMDSYQDFIDLNPEFLGNDVEVLEIINEHKNQQ